MSTHTTDAYLMTCGHMSDQNCECPDTEKLVHADELVKEIKTAVHETKSAATAPDSSKRNFLQESLALLETHFASLAVFLQNLRHDMETEYGLKTLSTDETTETI